MRFIFENSLKSFLRAEISSLKDHKGGSYQISIDFVKDFLLVFLYKTIGFELGLPVSSLSEDISALRKYFSEF